MGLTSVRNNVEPLRPVFKTVEKQRAMHTSWEGVWNYLNSDHLIYKCDSGTFPNLISCLIKHP